MVTEIDKDSHDACERSPAELKPGTFKPCGATPQSSSARIESSELVAIADLLEPTYRQTVAQFCWATGATTQDDVTAEAVERFCRVMERVGFRFGTNPTHFEMTVEDAVALAGQNGGRPRGRSTIARHRNRLARIRSWPRPCIEARVRPPGWIELDATEAAHVDGMDRHRGYLLVERLGAIRAAIPLKTFDLMMQSSSSPKVLAPVLVEEAAQIVAALQEQGRAFVATCHRDCVLLIIEGFWSALRRGE